MKRIVTTVFALSLMSGVAMAQATSKEQGATGGAAAGAATGAVGGAIVGGPVGAVVGGAIGAVAGAATGAAFTPEDRVYVKEYVVKHPRTVVTVSEPIVVGKPLPRSVQTYVIEGRPALKDYRYAYVNKQYLLIDAKGNVIGAID